MAIKNGKFGNTAVLTPPVGTKGFEFIDALNLREILNSYMMSGGDVRYFMPYGGNVRRLVEQFKEYQQSCQTVVLLMGGNQGVKYLTNARRADLYRERTKILFALSPVTIDVFGQDIFVFNWYRYKDSLLALHDQATRFLMVQKFGFPSAA